MTNSFKSGFVTIIGRPNVGKSTLLNAAAKEKIAIVSKKPQTTRNKINAVVTNERSQIIFIDTPGIHTPKSKLGNYMVKSAIKDLDGADVIILMTEPSMPSKKDNIALEKIKGSKSPVFLVINKIDTIEKQKLFAIIEQYTMLADFAEIIPISALRGDNLDILIETIEKYLPVGPMYYDADYITDQPEKQIVAEIIREKALRSLSDEVPHGIAVLVDTMRKRKDKDIIDITATIFCERPTHKGIIIGKNGRQLKKIGQKAREEIELRLASAVNLQLWVKVKKDWRDNDFFVKSFGYDIKKL